MMNPNGAIVGLIRGHTDPKRYSNLLRRNRLLRVNVLPQNKRDVIIFHEGNIMNQHQEMIAAGIPDIKFVNVRDEFRKPEEVPKGCRTNLGYKNMCRFYAIGIYDYLRDYDYMMRLDEDSFIESQIKYDVFRQMEEMELDYGYIHAEDDSHKDTLATFPRFSRTYALSRGLLDENEAEILNALHYYTNFMVTRVGFWRRPDVVDFLSAIDVSNGIYQYRWGDHIIQAHAVKLFSAPERIRQLTGFRYTHYSHRWSNYDRRNSSIGSDVRFTCSSRRPSYRGCRDVSTESVTRHNNGPQICLLRGTFDRS